MVISCGSFSNKVGASNNKGEINFKENKIYIPLNDDNVISVDIENKKILVNPIKGIIDNA